MKYINELGKYYLDRLINLGERGERFVYDNSIPHITLNIRKDYLVSWGDYRQHNHHLVISGRLPVRNPSNVSLVIDGFKVEPPRNPDDLCTWQLYIQWFLSPAAMSSEFYFRALTLGIHSTKRTYIYRSSDVFGRTLGGRVAVATAMLALGNFLSWMVQLLLSKSNRTPQIEEMIKDLTRTKKYLSPLCEPRELDYHRFDGARAPDSYSRLVKSLVLELGDVSEISKVPGLEEHVNVHYRN